MSEAFLQAFYAIDQDGSDEITIAELQEYMEQNNYDSKFVQKWILVFDPDRTGKITLDRFCDTLGLRVTEVKSERATFQSSGKARFPTDVTVITAEMELENQLKVIQIVRAGHSRHSLNKDVARYVKTECDSSFGKLWHVVIVKGQYWSYYSYQPNFNFVFKLGQYVYLIWRTPTI